MCEYCENIKLKDTLRTPKDYEETIAYIQSLIENQHFILIEGNSEIGSHKNENCQWIDDVIYHVIQCSKCGQVFTCVANAYRGGGSFKKGRL